MRGLGIIILLVFVVPFVTATHISDTLIGNYYNQLTNTTIDFLRNPYITDGGLPQYLYVYYNSPSFRAHGTFGFDSYHFPLVLHANLSNTTEWIVGTLHSY